MSAPAPFYVVACAAEHVQQDGSCAVPVHLPYHQPVIPPLSAADGSIVAFSIVGCWALGLKARMVFRAARVGHF
ncbi:hypothetical protein [Luteimonas sp. TWI1437]|uniref:hypothetical protein n=1 Tax=unclassified Luteimonas TaxID=2629088 RepID=UPI00320A3245